MCSHLARTSAATTPINILLVGALFLLCIPTRYATYDAIRQGIVTLVTEGTLLPQPFRLSAGVARLVARRVAEQLQALNTNDTKRVSVYQWANWIDTGRQADTNPVNSSDGPTLMEPGV
jgi:hypothetical protein